MRLLNPDEKAIKKRAKHFANPNCKKCNGRGYCGFYDPRNGKPRKVIICNCAKHGFPELEPEKSISDILDIRI